MSTDPQLHPKILLQNNIGIESLSKASHGSVVAKDDNVFGTIQTTKASNDDDEEEFHTPTSPKNIISKIVSCPPAPRKPARVPSCKRKLTFFEATERGEIDTFFNMVDVIHSNGASKRRYLV
ncbi:hypothetical protein Leryth_009757 [Lithospermum erythrorhizon]|nr:hypothetical protein Leryth_009757 [Lithospermum erythrorhizon]